MTALFLDQAYVAWAASQTSLAREEEFTQPVSMTMRLGTIQPKDDAVFFGLIEQRMVSIVFAFTALESFANESIPEGNIYRTPMDNGRCTEEYTKAQAEELSLDTKLGKVLPPIFDVNSRCKAGYGPSTR